MCYSQISKQGIHRDIFTGLGEVKVLERRQGKALDDEGEFRDG